MKFSDGFDENLDLRPQGLVIRHVNEAAVLVVRNDRVESVISVSRYIRYRQSQMASWLVAPIALQEEEPKILTGAQQGRRHAC